MLQPRHIALIAALAGPACVVGDEPPSGTYYLGAAAWGSSLIELTAAIEGAGAAYDGVYPAVNIVRFRASPAQAARIARHPGLLAIAPVSHLGGDPGEAALAPRAAPALPATGQIVPWGIGRVGGPLRASGATLWVLDGGVDLDHPDLDVDRERSIDLLAQRGDDREPDTAHGTAVAGVAAARDNDRDVVGVAPGARIVSVRVLDGTGAGGTDLLVAGLDYAAARAGRDDVLNLSLAAAGSSLIIETAVARVADLGVRVVLAAGNEHRDAREFTPAAIEHPGVYTVSAIGQDDCLAAFSNYGPAVDLAAPGRDIVTLRPGGGTIVVDGTSFAAPHVAGLLLAGALASDGAPCADGDGVAEPIAHR